MSRTGPASEDGLPSAVVAALEQVGFRNSQEAAETLRRLMHRLPPAVAKSLVPLLAESPDPDASLNLFERFVDSGDSELTRLLDQHGFLIHYTLVVFANSRFLADTLIRNPDLLHTFLREGSLDRSRTREEFHEELARYRARSFETDQALLLARFKRREYVRIMLRDVLGAAPLAEATAEISALADVLIEEALRESETAMQRRFGTPQHADAEGRVVETPFAVLSLGKLGGNELNYSSDVDLLFLYGDGEELGSAAISNREYFMRLAQQVSETLSRMTPEGRVFRIDLRLRPQGSEGEPAVALSHALRYFAETAHDWERQAMIKLRYCAGDAALARQFIRGVQKYVYSTDPGKTQAAGQVSTDGLNFAAIETALDTRERITARRRLAATDPANIDVKLDRGGIRDIEFLVQCLQRVYGGAEPWLRSGGTLFSLQKLHDKGHITGKEFHELTTAYEFLRRVEHRLQLRDGRQTHRLPHSRDELTVLCRSIHADESRNHSPEEVVETIRNRMAAVAQIYERVIHQQQLQQDREGEFRLHARMADESGADQPYQQLLQRLAEDSVPLYEIAMRPDLDAVTRRNLYRFLSAAFSSSDRYTTVINAPNAAHRALLLFATSEYLTDILIRYPEEISTLATPFAPGGETPELFERAADKTIAADPVFGFVASSGATYNEKLALLRRYYRHRAFASGAADILECRPVYESLSVSSQAADEAIRAAFTIAGDPPGMAVLALGRLGTQEFDLLSDADLLFVRDDSIEAAAAAKAAEQLMQALAAYTQDGTVFPVDPRLRPRGGEGELVVTPAQLQAYCAQEAQPWEALTYTKLRWLAGSKEIADQTRGAADGLLRRFAADPGFATAVREMRRRLETSDGGERNFKTAAGAVYDVDFIACYLRIRHGIRAQGGESSGNLRTRLEDLRKRELLTNKDFSTLDQAAEFLRTVEHVVRIVTGRARKTLPGTEHGRKVTERLTARIVRRELVGGLDAELVRTFQAVRELYERLVQ